MVISSARNAKPAGGTTFPAVATYKVPIGVAVVLALGLLSLRRSSPRWEEWGLVLPLLAWALFMMNSKVNIGYRHFLPAYVFAMAAACRCLERATVRWSAVAWCALGTAGLHAASYHPDYLCYTNLPRHKPYLAISDSNVDWGQGLKQARAWLDAHPQHGRTVSLHYFGTRAGGGGRRLLPGRPGRQVRRRRSSAALGSLDHQPGLRSGTLRRPGAYAALAAVRTRCRDRSWPARLRPRPARRRCAVLLDRPAGSLGRQAGLLPVRPLLGSASSRTSRSTARGRSLEIGTWGCCSNTLP